MALSPDQMRVILEIQTVGREQVEQVLSALRAAGITANQLGKSLAEDMAPGAREATSQFDRLGQRLQRQLSLTGLATQAFRQLGNIAGGLTFGVVVGAISSLTDQIIKGAVEWLKLSSATDRAKKSLEDYGKTYTDYAKQGLLDLQIQIEQTDSFFTLFTRTVERLQIGTRDYATEIAKLREELSKVRDVQALTGDFRNQRLSRTLAQSAPRVTEGFEVDLTSIDLTTRAMSELTSGAQGLAGALAVASKSFSPERQELLNEAIRRGGIFQVEWNRAVTDGTDTYEKFQAIEANGIVQEQLAIGIRDRARQSLEGIDLTQKQLGQSILDTNRAALSLGAVGFDAYIQALEQGALRTTALELAQQSATSETDRQRIAMESLQQAMQIGTIPAYEALGRAIQKGTDFSIEYQEELGKALTQEQIAHVIVNESIRQRADLLSLDERYTEQLRDLVPMIRGRNETEREEIADLAFSAQAKQTLLALDQALVSSAQQAILGQKSFGKALKEAVAAQLAAVAARSAVEALYMTGIGLAALTPWGAATYGPAGQWFAGAAKMLAVAAIAGVAARGLSGGASGGGGGGGGGGAQTDQQRLDDLRQQRRDRERDERLNQILDAEEGISSGSEATVNLNITIDGNGSELANALAPHLGSILIENGGVLGDVQVTGAERY